MDDQLFLTKQILNIILNIILNMRILITFLQLNSIQLSNEIDESKLFNVQWGGKKFKIYKNLEIDENKTYPESEQGWCDPNNFQLADATPSEDDQDSQAIESVGFIQSIFFRQIDVYKPLNLLTVSKLIDPEERATMLEEVREQQIKNPPFLMAVGLLGLVLTFICYCQQCIATCFQKVDPEDFNKFMLLRLMFFIVTLFLVLLTFSVSYFSFRGGPKAVRGFLNVSCTTQSFMQPLMVLGQNDNTNLNPLNNTSQCFQIFKDSQNMENAKWYQRGRNVIKELEVSTDCVSIYENSDIELDMVKLVQASDTLMETDPDQIQGAKIIFEDYDFDPNKRDDISGNTKLSQFVGLNALAPSIQSLLDNLSPSSPDSIAASFSTITDIWTGIDPNFQDVQENIAKWVSKPVNLYFSSSSNVKKTLSQVSSETTEMPQSPVFFDEDPAAGATPPLGILKPLANFNWQVMAPALSSNETERGIKYTIQPEAIIELDESLTPVDLTITNCISGPLLIVPLANNMYNTFAGIDLEEMLGEMDPDTIIDDFLKELGEQQTGFKDLQQNLPDQTTLNYIPIIINALALILMLLTATGLLLGFVQLFECAKITMNISWFCSFGLLSMSQVMTIIFMISTTAFSQVCQSIDGITLAPFAQQAVNSNQQLKDSVGIAGSCLWGDGQIVTSLLPNEVLLQLDSAFNKVPPSFIKTIGNSGANLLEDNSPKDSEDFCGYPMLFKSLDRNSSFQNNLSYNINLVNATDTVTVTTPAGSINMTQEELSWTSIHDVNYHVQNNPSFSSIQDSNGDFTIAQDLTTLSSLSNQTNGSGKLRVECAEAGGNIVFVVSENCSMTDSSATIKAINSFATDVTSDVASLTLDSTVQLCYDFYTFDDPNLQSSNNQLAYPLHTSIETYQSMSSTNGIPSHLLYGQANREAALDFFANSCENVSSYSGLQADILSNGTQVHKVLANKFAVFEHLFVTRMQSRLQEIMYQQTQFNKNDGDEFLNPSSNTKEQLEQPTSGASYLQLSNERSDLRAQAFDTFQEVLVVLPKFTEVQEAFVSLRDGINCSVILKKGLGSILASICAFDPKNPSLLSSLLEISFQQMLITILCTFGVCCGFCWKRQNLDVFEPTVQYDDSDDCDKTTVLI